MTKIVQANTPGGKKPGLLSHPQRTRRLIRWLNSIGAGLVCMQELSTPSKLVWRARWGWILLVGTPNNRGVWGLGSIGNGAAFRRGVWTKNGRPREVVLEGPTTLHIPVFYLKHEVLGTVAVYVVHLWAGERFANARFKAMWALAEDAEKQVFPVTMCGDWNDNRVPQFFRNRGKGWEVRGHHLDWEAVRGLDFRNADVTWALTGSVTDHPLVVGDVTRS